jgi:di/tricarboxylate transporter
MALFILCMAFKKVKFTIGAGLFLSFLLAIKAMSVEDAFASIKVKVILVSAASIGIGSALEDTRVAHFVAKGFISAARPLGPFGVYFAAYLIPFSLGVVISTNSAVVAICVPMIRALTAPENNVCREAVVFIMLCGSTACFTTPLGYVTNLMVQKDGKYTFGDFLRYGGPLQLVHCLATVFTCVWLAKDSDQCLPP